MKFKKRGSAAKRLFLRSTAAILLSTLFSNAIFAEPSIKVRSNTAAQSTQNNEQVTRASSETEWFSTVTTLSMLGIGLIALGVARRGKASKLQ